MSVGLAALSKSKMRTLGDSHRGHGDGDRDGGAFSDRSSRSNSGAGGLRVGSFGGGSNLGTRCRRGLAAEGEQLERRGKPKKRVGDNTQLNEPQHQLQRQHHCKQPGR